MDDEKTRLPVFGNAPWRARERGGLSGMVWCVEDGNGHQLVDLEDVVVYYGVNDGGERIAHMMAAAPDLYEALRALIPILKAVRYTAGLSGTQIARMEKAEAAIAKVRGEAS